MLCFQFRKPNPSRVFTGSVCGRLIAILVGWSIPSRFKSPLSSVLSKAGDRSETLVSVAIIRRAAIRPIRLGWLELRYRSQSDVVFSNLPVSLPRES